MQTSARKGAKQQRSDVLLILLALSLTSVWCGAESKRHRAPSPTSSKHGGGRGGGEGREVPTSISTALALKQRGDMDGAVRELRLYLADHQDDADALYILGNTLYQIGKLKDAKSVYSKCIEQAPSHGGALNNLGNVLKELGEMEAAADAYKRAAEVDPADVVPLANFGMLLTVLDRTVEAIDVLTKVVEKEPDIAEARANLGSALKNAGRYEEAIHQLEAAVRMQPHNGGMLGNLGSVLLDAGRREEARAMLKRAEQLDPSSPSIASTRIEADRPFLTPLEVQAEYEAALSRFPSHPSILSALAMQYYTAERYNDAKRGFEQALQREETALNHNNLGAVYSKLGEHDKALHHHYAAMQLDQHSALFQYNYGNALMQAGSERGKEDLLVHALTAYTSAIRLEPNNSAAMNNLANTLKEAGQLEYAMKAWECALRLQPDDNNVMGNLLHLKSFVCDWPTSSLLRRLRSAIAVSMRGGKEVEATALSSSSPSPAPSFLSIQPFHAMMYDVTSEEFLFLSSSFAREAERVAELKRPAPRTFVDASVVEARGGRITVGYVSADFGDHPTGHLVQFLPQLHNRAFTTVHLYALGGHDSSIFGMQLRDSCDQFRDVAALSFFDVSALINADKVDVLVDLTVWAKGRRPELFAVRPSPIQVSYLGYPATSGSSYHDYFVSDSVVAPPDYRHQYSEVQAYLPFTYQLNNHARMYGDVRKDALMQAKRAREEKEKSEKKAGEEEEEKEEGRIANFNQLYKLQPSLLDAYANVLRHTSSSSSIDVKLWLLRFPASGEKRVRQQLRMRGVSEERVIFGEQVGKVNHFRRIPLSSIMMDTMRINGHSTSTDTLFMSVPIVTLPSSTFAGRVTSSLLSACSLTQWIARDRKEYEDISKNILSSPSHISAAKRLVEEKCGPSSPLFDDSMRVRHIEVFYRIAVEISSAKEVPFHIVVYHADVV